MDERQRELFAALLREERTHRFGGSRKAAYTAAEVNSATWSRAEAAQTIKEQSRIRITKALWPWSGGDWVKVATSRHYDEDGHLVGGGPQDDGYVSAPGARAESPDSDLDVLAEVRAMRERLEAFEKRLMERRDS